MIGLKPSRADFGDFRKPGRQRCLDQIPAEVGRFRHLRHKLRRQFINRRTHRSSLL